MKVLAAALAVTVLGATASLDRQHAPLLAILANDPDDAGVCSPEQLQTAARTADVKIADLVLGGDLVLYAVQHPCLCGAQNCPYYLVRVSAHAKPRLVFKTYAIAVRTAPQTGSLIDLIVDAHDSALVTDETRYIYAYGRYQPLRSERIRNTDRARKPDGVAVRFAPGSSTALLHGSASLGWYDSYAFDAAKGQQLLIDGVRSRANLSLTLFGPDGKPFDLRAGVPLALPVSGRYQLHVENGAEQDLPYALTLAIR